MATNVENSFNIFLPSNASMGYFRDNTPDSYRTKLAHPITLSGEWEATLSEISLPGRFFTIQPNYNDEYTVEKWITVDETSLLPELILPIFDKNISNLADAINSNLKNLIDDPPFRVWFDDRSRFFWKLDPHWRVVMDMKNAQRFLYSMYLTRSVAMTAKDDPVTIFKEYRASESGYQGEFITLIAKKPIEKFRYEITLAHDIDKSIFDQINASIEEIAGQRHVEFEHDRNIVNVHMEKNVSVLLNRENCPNLMKALNIQSPMYLIQTSDTTRFSYTPVDTIHGEKFEVIVNAIFTRGRREQTTVTSKIPSGMYLNSVQFFDIFRDVILEEMPDMKTKLVVPRDVSIKFGDKLKDLLGFTGDTFSEGEYISEYILDLTAGITEIYVYTDIIESSLVGDAVASILKIVPIANEKAVQIVKHFPVPMYFRVKKEHFDTIQIELRTSRGTPLKFISGKTCAVLNFRRKII